MTFAAIAASPLPVPSRFRPDLPPAFDTWFRHALERDPNARFQTAKDLADDLAKALDRPPISLVNVGSGPSQIELEAIAGLQELQREEGVPSSQRGSGIKAAKTDVDEESEPLDLLTLSSRNLSATDLLRGPRGSSSLVAETKEGIGRWPVLPLARGVGGPRRRGLVRVREVPPPAAGRCEDRAGPGASHRPRQRRGLGLRAGALAVARAAQVDDPDRGGSGAPDRGRRRRRDAQVQGRIGRRGRGGREVVPRSSEARRRHDRAVQDGGALAPAPGLRRQYRSTGGRGDLEGRGRRVDRRSRAAGPRPRVLGAHRCRGSAHVGGARPHSRGRLRDAAGAADRGRSRRPSLLGQERPRAGREGALARSRWTHRWHERRRRRGEAGALLAGHGARARWQRLLGGLAGQPRQGRRRRVHPATRHRAGAARPRGARHRLRARQGEIVAGERSEPRRLEHEPLRGVCPRARQAALDRADACAALAARAADGRPARQDGQVRAVGHGGRQRGQGRRGVPVDGLHEGRVLPRLARSGQGRGRGGAHRSDNAARSSGESASRRAAGIRPWRSPRTVPRKSRSTKPVGSASRPSHATASERRAPSRRSPAICRGPGSLRAARAASGSSRGSTSRPGTPRHSWHVCNVGTEVRARGHSLRGALGIVGRHPRGRGDRGALSSERAYDARRNDVPRG